MAHKKISLNSISFNLYSYILERLAYTMRIRVRKEEKDQENAEAIDEEQQQGPSATPTASQLTRGCGEGDPMFPKSQLQEISLKSGSTGMTVMNHLKHSSNNPMMKWNNHQHQQQLQPLLLVQHKYNNTGNRYNNNEQQLPNKPPTETQIILNKLNILIRKLKEMEDEDEVTTEWRTVAMTLDRCLLILFFLVYFITIFACFLRSPGYVS